MDVILVDCCCFFFFFFFKQKTAYEIYQCDWSSDVCSSDLESLTLSLAIIAIECAAGALVGVLVSSVIVGIILVVITHNITLLVIIVPLITKLHNPIFIALLSGILLTSFFLGTAIWVFNKKQF